MKNIKVNDEVHGWFLRSIETKALERTLTNVLIESMQKIKKENFGLWEQVYKKYDLDRSKYHQYNYILHEIEEIEK